MGILRHTPDHHELWQSFLASEAREARSLRSYQLLLNLLHFRRGRRLLDIGCGDGALLELAARSGLHATGIEFSPETAVIAQKRAPLAKVAISSGEDLPFEDASFDLITVMEPWQSFLSPLEGMEEIRRVLRTGGRVCMILPNSDHFAAREQWLQFHQAGLGELFLSIKKWRSLLQRMGFKLLHIEPDFEAHQKYKAGTMSALLKAGFIWLAGTLRFWIPRRFIRQYVFICQKI
jgi:SAM-dependent methyltransferase